MDNTIVAVSRQTHSRIKRISKKYNLTVSSITDAALKQFIDRFEELERNGEIDKILEKRQTQIDYANKDFFEKIVDNAS